MHRNITDLLVNISEKIKKEKKMCSKSRM